MRIPLDNQSPIPLYRQIENYLREQILAENLAPSTRLPATRRLAADLGVSRITVKNAYAELESEGLLISREGSGTYVTQSLFRNETKRQNIPIEWPLWQLNLDVEVESTSPKDFSPQPAPDMISFTGVGNPDQFPIKDFYQALRNVIQNDGIHAFDYGSFDGGYLPLRETITHVLASQGIQAPAQNILITSGSQQALALVCQILLKPGDVVLVEKPTYNLALELFRSLELKIVGIEIDENGMQVEILEHLLQKYHPKLIYTIPNFQNPSGVCLSGERRRRMISLADRYNVPILEDDFVGDLRYDGRALPAIKGLDPGGHVIYTGTFSKMLMPGLRVGYLVADGPVMRRLIGAKMVSDLTTSTLIQRTLHEYVTVGRYQIHLRRSIRSYRSRRDAMLEAINCHLPQDTGVIPPKGGLFIWVTLPEGQSSTSLLPRCVRTGVEFAPGSRFFPDPDEGERFLRLNFATQTPERIDEGIRRLGQAVIS